MLESMPEEVRSGLTASPKRLAPKYFYDKAGSLLFERITELPEYYQTRAERDLLQEIAAELMADLRPQQIVELGSGSSYKTRQLLSAPSAPEHLKTYVPFDVSESIVQEASQALVVEYPYLAVHGVIGDFGRHLGHIPSSTGPRLVLFLGGTIGNLDPQERIEFLRQVNELLGPDDRLLIGMDLVKDVSIIEAAYNDSAGVTAAFNRNMLHFLNRTLNGDFEPDAFEHYCFFNQAESRIEMHLVPKTTQVVTLRELGMAVTFTPDESLWTECSYKFTENSLNEMLANAGLALQRFYTNEDPERLFGLALVGPID
jgi:L-histidine N-alpha-methyltransferase